MNNEEEAMDNRWIYSEWGDTWYVNNLRYPNGAVGCVARGANGGWAIACHPDAGEFPARDEAADAEYRLVKAMKEQSV